MSSCRNKTRSAVNEVGGNDVAASKVEILSEVARHVYPHESVAALPSAPGRTRRSWRFWDTVTNHASPLFDSRQDPNYGQGLDIEDTISGYLKAGVPGKKIVLGVPLYGAGWQGVPGANNGLYQTSTGPAISPTGDTLATDGVATYNTLQVPPPDLPRPLTGAGLPFQSTTRRSRPFGRTTTPRRRALRWLTFSSACRGDWAGPSPGL
jgi:Glycosyl hydrolases family 18